MIGKKQILLLENPEFKEPTSGMKPQLKSRNKLYQKEYSELQSMFPDVQDSVVGSLSFGKNKVIVNLFQKAPILIKQNLNSNLYYFTIENGKNYKGLLILIILRT